MKKPIGQRIITVIIVAGLILLAVVAFRPEPIPVELSTISRGPLMEVIQEDAVTRVKERYVVSSPLSGNLRRIQVEAGDNVEAGKTILATIDPTAPTLLDVRAQAEAKARVSAAEAALKQAESLAGKSLAEMNAAESNAGRVRSLHEKGAATRDELEDAELDEKTTHDSYRAAMFAAEIAEYELQLSKIALMRITAEDSTQEDWQVNILSPINGQVLRLFREDAGVVSPSTNLMEVGDTSDLELEIDVLSTDAVRIRPGDKILVEHWGKDVPLNAVVRLVEPAAFTKVSALGVEEQRVNVIADLTDPPEKWETLGDAYRVDVRIVTWEQDDLLLVPTSALFRYGESWSVFCDRNQLAELTTVEVGHSDGKLTEVISGLEAGDRVIVHPSDQVKHNVKVEELKAD